MEIMRREYQLYTDLEGMLESIASTKQVERKSLHMVIQDMKDRLADGDILLYHLILTCLMWKMP